MKHYCPKCGKELYDEQVNCPKCNCCSVLEQLKDVSEDGISGYLTSNQIELNSQWLKYKCGKDGAAGHGFAAEDYNTLHDVWNGKHVDQTGRDNDLYGPDRVVNGNPIQTKYYSTAHGSVNAGFCGENGKYAYINTDGSIQVLEVPFEQYDEAVKIFQEKIKEGKVDGVTDPKEAKNIVKQGQCTYRQAKNLTKAGNIDSLIFDAQSQSIVALSAFGISFAINLGMAVIFHAKDKQDLTAAIDASFFSGLQNGTITLTSGILTVQLLKTQFGRNANAFLHHCIKPGIDKLYKTEYGKQIVNKLAGGIFNKNLSGAAAKNALIKFTRTNIFTNIVLTTILTIPDTFRLIGKKISGPQFVKNLVVNNSSIAGATVGVLIGNLAGPGGAFIGALGGGKISGWTTKAIADTIRKDDTEMMQNLVSVALFQLSNDYLIQTDDEFQRCINSIVREKAIDTNLLRAMYSAGLEDGNDLRRIQIAYAKLRYYFDAVIRQRKTFHLLNNQELLLNTINGLSDMLKE